MTPPRLLTRADLRAYLRDMAWGDIAERMARGRLPRPLWGLEPEDKRARWDRRAVDRALDLASNIPPTIEQATAELDRAFGLAR